MVSVDTTNEKGVWHSDYEVRTDKEGRVISDIKKDRVQWDGTLTLPPDSPAPKRIKVRSIAGTETIKVI